MKRADGKKLSLIFLVESTQKTKEESKSFCREKDTLFSKYMELTLSPALYVHRKKVTCFWTICEGNYKTYPRQIKCNVKTILSDEQNRQ
jgi:hypothetical protein